MKKTSSSANGLAASSRIPYADVACDAVKTGAAFVARHLGIRTRHIMTRAGRVRLRYVAMPMVLIPLMTASVQNISFSSSHSYSLNDIQTAAGTEMAEHQVAQKLDGSRYGQLSIADLMAKAMPSPTEKIVTVESGDALGTVMEKAGIGAAESTDVIAAMKAHFDPRKLKAGQNIHMKFEPTSEGGMRFAHMEMKIDPLKTLVVSRNGDDYRSAVDEKEVERKVRAKGAKIEVSLYGSAAKVGIPQSVVAEAIRIYSQNIDFQRDIRQGDTLEVMYDSYETEDGYVAKTGDVLYAKLTLGGKEIPLYRYAMSDGRIDYFTPEGRSSRRTLMKTPIDGARMSSGYGMRRHPVLGYNKMHKGIDFAAPIGTPIYAAGDGIVEKAGRFSSYGNYVRIRHNTSLSTAYAHMSRIKARPGARVKQGELIGYVGNTGRSTGPHLHYEVLIGGKHVNPRSLNLPTGENLGGKELKRFKQTIAGIEQQYASIAHGVKFAFFSGGERSNDKVN